MNANLLCGMAAISMAMLGLAQVVPADMLKKNAGVVAAAPIAAKEARAATKPGVSATDKLKGAPAGQTWSWAVITSAARCRRVFLA